MKRTLIIGTSDESFLYKKRTIMLSRGQSMVFAMIIVFFLGALFRLEWRQAAAKAACPMERNSTINLNWEPELAAIDRAIGFNPGNAAYHLKRALHFMSSGTMTEREQYDAHLGACYRRNPAQGQVWYWFGRVYSQNRDDRLAYLKKWLPLAGDCFMVFGIVPPQNHELKSLVMQEIAKQGNK